MNQCLLDQCLKRINLYACWECEREKHKQRETPRDRRFHFLKALTLIYHETESSQYIDRFHVSFLIIQLWYGAYVAIDDGLLMSNKEHFAMVGLGKTDAS